MQFTLNCEHAAANIISGEFRAAVNLDSSPRDTFQTIYDNDTQCTFHNQLQTHFAAESTRFIPTVFPARRSYSPPPARLAMAH